MRFIFIGLLFCLISETTQGMYRVYELNGEKIAEADTSHELEGALPTRKGDGPALEPGPDGKYHERYVPCHKSIGEDPSGEEVVPVPFPTGPGDWQKISVPHGISFEVGPGFILLNDSLALGEYDDYERHNIEIYIPGLKLGQQITEEKICSQIKPVVTRVDLIVSCKETIIHQNETRLVYLSEDVFIRNIRLIQPDFRIDFRFPKSPWTYETLLDSLQEFALSIIRKHFPENNIFKNEQFASSLELELRNSEEIAPEEFQKALAGAVRELAHRFMADSMERARKKYLSVEDIARDMLKE